jgi:hypothetical protein
VRESQRLSQRDSRRRALQGWSLRLALRAALPLQVVQAPQVVRALRVVLLLQVVLAPPVAALQAVQEPQPALAER